MRTRSIILLLLLFSILAACGPATSTERPGGAPAGALEISILYGSEKQAWMEAVVQTFNAQAAKAPGGKPIYVSATPIGSNESLNQILSGKAQPTVWSPYAAGVLIPPANAQWSQALTATSL